MAFIPDHCLMMVLFKELVHYLMLANELCKQAVHTEYVHGDIVSADIWKINKKTKPVFNII